MAVQLTQGAVERMCSGDTEIKPLLQVTDIRLVSSSNQTSTNERYRMLLSDGLYTQQGMLATQRNDLVKSGKLQKGSIVQLLQFVCNLIQNRKIIIVIDLDLVHEQCDPIGQPSLYVLPGVAGASAGVVARPAPLQSSADSNTVSGNVQCGNNYYPRSTGGGGGPAVQPPRMERGPELQSNGSSYASNLSTGRFSTTNAASMHPRPGFASGDSAGGFNNYRSEVSHGPPSTRPPQPVYQQPPSIYMNRGPIAKNEAAPRIIPIAALNPYQGRWTIKARVTAKSELRRYSNPRGEGKVFSFDLLDSDGGEIRVTCFNAVADQFYEQIEVGKVYLISKGSLKPAQKNFNHLRNDHEIFLESTSIVQACFDDDSSIPKQQFHFRPISDVEGMENNSVVDIIGIVSSINPSSTIMRKNNTETQKRTLQLKDTSGKSVELVLWGNFCNAEGQELQSMCDSGRFPVLAAKAVRVNDFNGKAVGTLSTSQLFIEPDFTEARTLREWFEREGRNTPSVSISRDSSSISRTDVRKTVSQIKDDKLGTSEKPDYITVCAHISFIKVENFCYTACPLMVGERKCSKKVINNGDGKWHCDRCDQSVDECEYRYILQCQIQDHTALTWVTAFQEMGEEIMGLPAKELYYMKYEEQDDKKFNEAIYRVLFSKYIFKLKVKEETFSDEQRVKSTVMKADRVNFSSEARFLTELMTKLKTEGSNPPMVATSSYVTGQSAAPPTTYDANAGFSSRETGVSANQTTPFGNQYGGSGYTSGNTSGITYASCSSCGGAGHSAVNCPSVMSGPGQLTGGYVGRTNSGGDECHKCHQTGHWARDCPGSGSFQSGPGSFGAAGGGGGGGECFKCHQTGHFARDCPGSGAAQSGPGSFGGGGGGGGGECFKCHQFGHWARDCPGVSSVAPAYGMQKQHLGGY